MLESIELHLANGATILNSCQADARRNLGPSHLCCCVAASWKLQKIGHGFNMRLRHRRKKSLAFSLRPKTAFFASLQCPLGTGHLVLDEALRGPGCNWNLRFRILLPHVVLTWSRV